MSVKVTIEDRSRTTEYNIPEDSIRIIEELLKLYSTGAQNIPKQTSRLPGTVKEE